LKKLEGLVLLGFPQQLISWTVIVVPPAIRLFVEKEIVWLDSVQAGMVELAPKNRMHWGI
jgi:hypothetical protein